MARVSVSSPEMFDALVFGEQHSGTYNFIRDQVENLTPALTEAGKRFMANSRELFDKLAGETAMNTLRAAKRMWGGMWRPNIINKLWSYEDIQSAQPIMKRYIMANPHVREAYQEQRIAGYDGTYKDPFADDTIENHYDYRRVMNGVVVDSVEHDYTVTNYYDEPMYGDSDKMDFLDQLDIIYTWERVVDMIKNGGKDPTSLFGSDL